MELNALKSPAVGCTTSRLNSCSMTPPPTGTSDFFTVTGPCDAFDPPDARARRHDRRRHEREPDGSGAGEHRPAAGVAALAVGHACLLLSGSRTFQGGGRP